MVWKSLRLSYCFSTNEKKLAEKTNLTLDQVTNRLKYRRSKLKDSKPDCKKNKITTENEKSSGEEHPFANHDPTQNVKQETGLDEEEINL